jgi:hypothetical protein
VIASAPLPPIKTTYGVRIYRRKDLLFVAPSLILPAGGMMVLTGARVLTTGYADLDESVRDADQRARKTLKMPTSAWPFDEGEASLRRAAGRKSPLEFAKGLVECGMRSSPETTSLSILVWRRGRMGLSRYDQRDLEFAGRVPLADLVPVAKAFLDEEAGPIRDSRARKLAPHPASAVRHHEITPWWWEVLDSWDPVRDKVTRLMAKSVPNGVHAPLGSSARLVFIVPSAKVLTDEAATELHRKLAAKVASLGPDS